MKKSFLRVVLVLMFSILLVGCTELSSGGYETWINSDEAEDLNGDSVIDEADYELFLDNIAYELWRDSDDAEDINGDRKIDKLDYELFLNPVLSDYEIWKDSDDASDLNSDGSINEVDYALYLVEIAYLAWKNSDDAEDLNGDRKIDKLDYELFLNPVLSDYEIWKDSDDAEDLNGDRIINEADYELFLNPVLSDYEIWKDSNDASDLNSDGSINEADYAIFLQFSEFLGEYSVSNYSFVGSEHIYVGNKIYLFELGLYLEEMVFTVDSNGDITASIPISTIATFEDDFAIILQALDNMTISRISLFLVGIDTSMTIDGVDINVTVYFEEIENGFRTSYQFNYKDDTGVIYFDLIKN